MTGYMFGIRIVPGTEVYADPPVHDDEYAVTLRKRVLDREWWVIQLVWPSRRDRDKGLLTLWQIEQNCLAISRDYGGAL